MSHMDETGAATAEAAVVIPVLVLVTMALAWMVALGVTQVRVTDGAREAARALAREDDRAAAIALGKQVAPVGSRFAVSEDAGTVTVTVRAEVRLGDGLLRLPGFTASATAVAARERQ